MLEDTFNPTFPNPIPSQRSHQENDTPVDYSPSSSVNPYSGPELRGQIHPASQAFAANYAMHQGIQSQGQNFQADFSGMYRSSLMHSHAKPPYSYISLIAMAIQVNLIDNN